MDDDPADAMDPVVMQKKYIANAALEGEALHKDPNEVRQEAHEAV